ncbi:MAG: Exodeoxyribonuclease 7 large subunit [Chlamydiae bacterium]|nr:Exodeoxyribonuclease 7 large subunit [Chlamydiota bacterium]
MNENEIISVSQLTAAIKQKLESAFSFISLRGEVSNLRKQASGHVYFTLKDQGAQISAVLFRGNAMHLSRLPKEGDQIIVRGQLSVYAPRGNYQVIVREVEFSGVGELLKRLHELKIKLEGLGWFDPSCKKPLPKIPKTIGVVTSPTGSVIQDILNVLKRRFSGFHLILNPVRVQGDEAAMEIAKAIEDFNRYGLADVLIVGRGGGSLEDLWPFNEEIVATAIHNSQIPIISAVGHETDFTISDFVADLRAPTPSAAAEIVTGEKSQLLQTLERTKASILHSMQSHLRSHRKMLENLAKQPPLSSPYTILGPYLQKLDDFQGDINSSVQSTLSHYQLKLEGLVKQKEALKPDAKIAVLKENFARQKRSLHFTMHRSISQRRQRLYQLTEHLRAIDPRNLLKKGYSILFHEKNDSVILSTRDVDPGETLRVQVSDGKLLVNVKEKI